MTPYSIKMFMVGQLNRQMALTPTTSTDWAEKFGTTPDIIERYLEQVVRGFDLNVPFDAIYQRSSVPATAGGHDCPVLKVADERPCLVCGHPTHWRAVNIEAAPLCSDACATKLLASIDESLLQAKERWDAFQRTLDTGG